MIYTTHNREETQSIAANFVKELKGGEFISLIGDLGSGKTTFVQGLVVALGSTARVKSPTFTVMNEYKVNSGVRSSEVNSSIKRIIHCDFYRFTKAEELGALELDEYRRPDTIILAEWPDILSDVLWKPDITITLKHMGNDEREIVIEFY